MGSMPLLRRRGPEGSWPGTATGPPGPAQAGDELDDRVAASARHRGLVLRVLLTVFLAIPAVAMLVGQGFTGRVIFLVPATAVFAVLVGYLVGGPAPLSRWQRWHPVLRAGTVVVGAALFLVGSMSWLTALAVVAAVLGRFHPPRTAVLGTAACAALGLAFTVAQHLGYGNVISATIVPALAGFLAHSAERRNDLISRLRDTRAELARAAVAEERLRIARDLHDLLGHSLSLIALKAELAGRLVGADPGRAALEIADLETVARRSLTEVRQAVTSYRQPGLSAELAAGHRMLTAAGIACQVEAPGCWSFPPAVDALLAWTVREGTTNIVRHAQARRASIRVEVTGEEVCAELTDDGTGPAQAVASGLGAAGGQVPGSGSGLAGLAERVRCLGGTLRAGAEERGGFRLRVTVPLGDGSPHREGIPALAEEASA